MATKVGETARLAAPFHGGFPAQDEARKARDAGDFEHAVTAYRFWYPTVSCEGIFNGNRELGVRDNEAFMIASVGPRQVAFTANADTPYGVGALDLSHGPYVIEVPPGPFIGLVDDRHQGWILDMGLPGPAGDKGGRHLILPPGHDGAVPDGYFTGRSTSKKVLAAVRALPVGGDVKGALEALRRIRIHPLSDPGRTLQFIDTTGKPADASCLRWESGIDFWRKLHEVLGAEPLAEHFLPMYGMLASLGIERGKPFAPDERMTAILDSAARVGRDEMLVAAFASAREDRIAWPDRRWEWIGLVPDSAQFETASGFDMEARDRWFAQAIVTSPAMFRRSAGAGSLYWLSHHDAEGAYVDGGRTYRLTVPLPVPAGLFWSVTLYDAATRSMVQTVQNKAALRSLFELKDVGASGSVDLYFGPTAPAGNEGRWIQTIPGKGWFCYFRIYGPQAAAFDGTWKPGDFVQA